jgi:hypothetical protein
MTPEQIRTKKNNLFATFDDIDAVIKWGEGVEDCCTAMVMIGIAVNTTLEMLAKELEDE